MNRKILIFDTTLRDGEQSLQASLNVNDKLQIALSLEKMKIDIIEAGFPISSPGDFKSVQTIASHIKNSKICSLARCVQKDIDTAVQAMSIAKFFRIHIFLGTSNLHIKSKLKKSFEEILDMAIYFVKYARKFTDDVEFSCEDAGRTPINNLCKIVEKTIQAGATTINIPDTVGYTIPNQFSNIIKNLYNNVNNIHKAIISVHCHNDLGMAVANSISAIQSGAGQVEGTINGIGERAGNTALEELVIAMKIRKDYLKVNTNINYQEIFNTSKTVSQLCKMPIPANKAIVGSNAFSHSSGIHQDGVLKNRENYEIITPSLIGLKKNELNLTSRSGRAAIKYFMKKMNYLDTEYDLNLLYNKFLKLADKKGQVFDYDLEALAFIKNYEKLSEYYKLKNFNIELKSDKTIILHIKILGGNKIHAKTIHDNCELIEIVYKALTQITNYTTVLEKFNLITKKQQHNTVNQTNVVIKHKNKLFYGRSSNSNTILSYIHAIIKTFNNIFQYRQIKTKIH